MPAPLGEWTIVLPPCSHAMGCAVAGGQRGLTRKSPCTRPTQRRQSGRSGGRRAWRRRL